VPRSGVDCGAGQVVAGEACVDCPAATEGEPYHQHRGAVPLLRHLVHLYIDPERGPRFRAVGPAGDALAEGPLVAWHSAALPAPRPLCRAPSGWATSPAWARGARLIVIVAVCARARRRA